MTAKAAALVILAAMLAGPAAAGDSTVEALYRRCSGANPDKVLTDRVFCLGYVQGVADMMLVNSFDTSQKHVSACFSNTDTTALVQAFVNYAIQYPETWSDQAEFGVIKALRETWPCQK
jgi:hypothetical protein